MKEYRVIVWKDKEGIHWSTAQYRKVYFLWRTLWRDIEPICQQTPKAAFELIEIDKLQ